MGLWPGSWTGIPMHSWAAGRRKVWRAETEKVAEARGLRGSSGVLFVGVGDCPDASLLCSAVGVGIWEVLGQMDACAGFGDLGFLEVAASEVRPIVFFGGAGGVYGARR